MPAGSLPIVEAGLGPRVLVIDDHQAYAEAVALALSIRIPGSEPAHVHSIRAASDAIAISRYDIILVDWQIGNDDGIAAGGRILTDDPTVHMIVVTAHHSLLAERLARDAGACAALPKHASIAAIVEAVQHCYHGTEPPWAVLDEPAVGLSPRQVEVISMLAGGADVKTIATTLFLSVETVRSYLKDAMRRLDAHSQLETVAIARREGLIPPSDGAL